jgi:hypothetical protein
VSWLPLAFHRKQNGLSPLGHLRPRVNRGDPTVKCTIIKKRFNMMPDFGIARKRCEQIYKCRFGDFPDAHTHNCNVVLCISLIGTLFYFATSDE